MGAVPKKSVMDATFCFLALSDCLSVLWWVLGVTGLFPGVDFLAEDVGVALGVVFGFLTEISSSSESKIKRYKLCFVFPLIKPT